MNRREALKTGMAAVAGFLGNRPSSGAVAVEVYRSPIRNDGLVFPATITLGEELDFINPKVIEAINSWSRHGADCVEAMREQFP